jgi:hypothetical protein
VVGTVAVFVALHAASTARAASPPQVARPDPVVATLHLDYVSPIPGRFAPLSPAVITAALNDQRNLAYASPGDLGGFVRAPVGEHAASSGGRNLVGGGGRAEIPQFARAGGGSVMSFAVVEGGTTATPPDNGQQPVPGLPRPAPFLPPQPNDNSIPPPNEGFGGTPTTTTTAPATTTTPPVTTTPLPTTTTTPPPTTTAPPPTTTAPPPPAPSPQPRAEPSGGGSCGATGLTIESDQATCRIDALNMAPGGSASETLTITNDSGEPFTLSLRATGMQNRLWTDLRLGVWQAGTPAPQPLPPLLWWTTQDNPLTTLQPGETVRYRVELYLPPNAGNDTQALVASVDFVWKARA